MGLPFGWVILNIYHNWLIEEATKWLPSRPAAEGLDSKRYTERKRAAVWGDDLVAKWLPTTIRRYHELLALTNAKISAGKHYVSTRNAVFCEWLMDDSTCVGGLIQIPGIMSIGGLVMPG